MKAARVSMNAPARFSAGLLVAAALAVVLASVAAASPLPGLHHSSAHAVVAVEAVAAVDAVGMTVSNLDRAVAFYTGLLDFEQVEVVEVTGDAYDELQGLFALRMRVARLRLGDEYLELTEYLTPRGRPAPDDSRSNDGWFQHIAIIVSDMERAYRRIATAGTEHISPEPQRLPDWNPNAGGIEAFYFRDPDRHALELLRFPPDKGAPRWQRRDRLFLGIDHTAIAVRDTGTSLHFYRDLLGMTVAGESMNHGREQERLNQVRGARLRITALRAPRGPGIELLEYLTPRDGRPMPVDARANDLSHWQTRLVAVDLDPLADDLRDARTPLVSAGPVALPDRELGFARALMVRDPDGHALQLATPSLSPGQGNTTSLSRGQGRNIRRNP